MRTKNAMRLKAIIRNKAKDEGIPPRLVMQNYLLERLLERISLSAWRDRVVIKGGMLISSLVGVDKRSAKVLDTTVRGFPLTHGHVGEAWHACCDEPLPRGDGRGGSDAGMLGQWVAYARGYPYVGDMTLREACGTVVAIMEAINW